MVLISVHLVLCSSPHTLYQNVGCEHTYTIVELDGEGAECVCVPAADSRYT